MDNSFGDQSYHKRGLLPAVDVLKPGLYLLFTHSGVDVRYMQQHAIKLNEALEKDGLRPSFMQKDLAQMPMIDVYNKLEQLRADAIRDGRVYFVLTPAFKPRVHALEGRVDMSWHVHAYDDSAAMMVSPRGFSGVGPYQLSPDNYAFRLWLEPREPKRLPNPVLDSKSEIQIHVMGAPHIGKTAVAAVIHEALLVKWPNITVRWRNDDNDQEKMQSKIYHGLHETIGAKSFALIERNAYLEQPTPSVITTEEPSA